MQLKILKRRTDQLVKQQSAIVSQEKHLLIKKNKRRNSDKVGHPTVLTPEEENELKNNIFYMLSHVFPLNLKHKALLWL